MKDDALATSLAERSREQWQQEVLNLVRDAQSEFTALMPAETGLPMTVYASERDDCLALIVDSLPGVHYAPALGSRVCAIGALTGDKTVDHWVNENVDALRGYAHGQFDTIEFYQRMRPVRSE